MRRVLLVPVAAAAVLAAAVACGNGVDTSPIENPITGGPAPASARPDVSLPPATGMWTGLAAECPDLTGAEAGRLGASGPGRPTDEYIRAGTTVTPDCDWGSTDDQGLKVTARVSIYRVLAATDAQWQGVRGLESGEPVPGVGREAFAGPGVGNMTVRVLSNNAVVTVKVIPPKASASPAELEKLRAPAIAVAKDVIDDLR